MGWFLKLSILTLLIHVNVAVNSIPKKLTTQNISFVDENKYINISRTEYVPIGDGFSVFCGDYSQPSIYLNCQLYDPQGTLVLFGESGCSYSVPTSKMSDYGIWKCVLPLKHNMLPEIKYYNFVEKEQVNINLWQNETNTHVNIGCSINNLHIYATQNDFCEMTRPDGETFYLKDRFEAGRYTAFGTDISKAVCGMEIKKPLEEFEKGLWRCGYVHEHKPIGGFINLNGTSTYKVIPKMERPSLKRTNFHDLPKFIVPPVEVPKKILTVVKNSLSISCRVPYSSSYCYMRGPNGTIYPVEDNLKPTVGLCAFTKKEATMEDNGIWYCGFAKETGEADELYSFEIVVLENYDVKPEKKDVETTVGSTAYLKCSTKYLGDYPVQYCRFKNKHGQIYNINPDEKSKNRMSYYGRGFKYGDCGIEIKNVTYADVGPWTCITRIGYNFRRPEIYSEISLLIK